MVRNGVIILLSIKLIKESQLTDRLSHISEFFKMVCYSKSVKRRTKLLEHKRGEKNKIRDEKLKLKIIKLDFQNSRVFRVSRKNFKRQKPKIKQESRSCRQSAQEKRK